MENTNLYRVLWVDDDESIVDSVAIYAEETFNIYLDVAETWEAAEEKLRTSFNEYSAIILDANCKVNKNDALPTHKFLGEVTNRLAVIFGEKQKMIPWYVFSAGTMRDFGVISDLINTEERQKQEQYWGPMLYFKDNVDGNDKHALFENISRIAKDNTINTVLFRHKDVFRYLGKADFVDYVKSRAIMLKMLSALYYPEENLNFVYEGNPLRHVVEYIFRTAKDMGILPEDCFDADDHVILLDASRYLACMTIKCYDKNNRKTVTHFARMQPGIKAVFSEADADIVQSILNFSSAESHTSKYDPYVIEEDKKEIFFGYVLQLSHVIKVFGKYIEEHPNKEANKTLTEIIKIPQNGDKRTISTDSTGKVALFDENCKIKNSFLSGEGRMVEIVSVSPNENKKDRDKYPIFAEVRYVETKYKK